MRSKYQSIRSNTESEVNILPLIDVLFAILIFFMLSSIVLTKKNQITVQRPENSQTEKAGKANKTVIITLKKNKKLRNFHELSGDREGGLFISYIHDNFWEANLFLFLSFKHSYSDFDFVFDFDLGSVKINIPYNILNQLNHN